MTGAAAALATEVACFDMDCAWAGEQRNAAAAAAAIARVIIVASLRRAFTAPETREDTPLDVRVHQCGPTMGDHIGAI